MKIGRALRELAKKGILPLSGDVTSERLERLQKLLVIMRLEGRREAKLLIDTNGGDSNSALSFTDAVALLPLELTGFVVGKCFSAGMTILEACHRRLATPHSRFMLHFGSTRGRFTYRGDEEACMRKFRAALEFAKRRLELDVALIARRSGLSAERVLELMRDGDENERFLSAAEALKLGLIDEIVTDFKLPLL